MTPIPRYTPAVLFGGLVMRTDPAGPYVSHAGHLAALKAANDHIASVLEDRDRIHKDACDTYYALIVLRDERDRLTRALRVIADAADRDPVEDVDGWYADSSAALIARQALDKPDTKGTAP